MLKPANERGLPGRGRLVRSPGAHDAQRTRRSCRCRGVFDAPEGAIPLLRSVADATYSSVSEYSGQSHLHLVENDPALHSVLDWASQPAGLAVVAAVLAVAYVSPTPLQTGHPSSIQEVLEEYDPVANDLYWQSRPVTVVRQALRVAWELGRLYTAFALDSLRGQLETRAQARAVMLSNSIERLGPVYIKVAQVLSTRTDIVSAAQAAELAKLQDRVKPFPNATAYGVLVDSLGVPMAAVFEELGPEPISAASLGQVYKAKLTRRYGGHVVAVKVQRPGVLEAISLDIHLMRRLILALRALRPPARDAAPPSSTAAVSAGGRRGNGVGGNGLVEVIDLWALRFFPEANFRTEARHMAQLGQDLKGVQGVATPVCIEPLSSAAVLVTKWVEGVKVTSLPDARLLDLQATLVYAYLYQLLERGFMHADPHPGNLLFTADGFLCILDYGLVTEVTAAQQASLLALLVHLATEDWTKLLYDLRELGFVPADVDPLDAGLLPPVKRILSRLTSPGDAVPLAVDDAVTELKALSTDYPFSIPPFCLLILRTFAVIEGIGRVLDPAYSIVNACLPFVTAKIIRDDSPQTRALLQRALCGDAVRVQPERLRRIVAAYLATVQHSTPASGAPAAPRRSIRISDTAVQTQGSAVAAASARGTLAQRRSQLPDLVLSRAGLDVPGVLFEELTGRPNQALVDDSLRNLLMLLFSAERTYFQELLLEEVAEALEDYLVAAFRRSTQGLGVPPLLGRAATTAAQANSGQAGDGRGQEAEQLLASAQMLLNAALQRVGLPTVQAGAGGPPAGTSDLSVSIVLLKLLTEASALTTQLSPGLRNAGSSLANKLTQRLLRRLGELRIQPAFPAI